MKHCLCFFNIPFSIFARKEANPKINMIKDIFSNISLQ
ncbi:hypothetical protein HFN_0426 [Helicobacter fennelliae MRY12-0050]|uniref:Uncharacterized protein n=1 Tax=Helicobacter fennelliae MRY12-0050 TaxID=1325130 RepID=T1CZD0_9HELI|nr:hypothetical protein HFN_0426 [Helicobacter fennelliae MRY12-0050]